MSEIPAPSSDWTAQTLAGFSDDHTVLYAYQGERTLAIVTVETGRTLSVNAVGDLWASTFSENGYEQVSRSAAVVDGHEAVEFVSTNPGNAKQLATTSDEHVFPVGSVIWVIGWGSPPPPFDAADETFTTATGTIAILDG